MRQRRIQYRPAWPAALLAGSLLCWALTSAADTAPDTRIAGTLNGVLTPPDDSYAPRLDPLDATTGSQSARRAAPDLWPQLAAEFQLVDQAPKEKLTKAIARYRRNPLILKKLTKRSDPYMAYIVQEVRARGMPMEIALLPMVESGFDPFAYSPGRAAGLWQFIPMTARHVGLKLNWWYDGRRDLIAGTNAALDYLVDLHRRLNDDWLLALAAYNSGAGTVHKAMTRARRNGKEPTYWNLRLPVETQRYVPKLLALAEVVRSHEEFGLARPPLNSRQQFVKISTGGQLDLASAAKMAGITIDELYRLNPAFNRWTTDPDGPHHLLIPVESRTQFIDELEQLERKPRVNWRRYSVRSGDSLIMLAEQFNTNTETLQAVNKLDGEMIRTGQTLMVPVNSSGGGYFSLTEEQLEAALARRVKLPSHSRILHTVKPGESLWHIGKRYGVSFLQLKRWNKKTGDAVIKPGEKLVIWRYRAEDKNNQGMAGGPGVTRKVRYKVRNGDSLDRIANRFDVAVDDIAKWNGIDPAKYIQPGQQLTLYVNVTGA